METIQLHVLTPDHAEKLIARIWYVLEQHDIASPHIDTRQNGNNRIAVRITFQTQRDADTISAALQGMWSVAAEAPGTRRKAL